jgi:hypothetical protein
MSEQRNSDFEARLMALANQFPYPQTPDIAGKFDWRLGDRRRGVFQIRRIAWVVIILVAVMASLFAVPNVRARLLQFLQIGSIRILLAEPTLTSTPTQTLSTERANLQITATVTPVGVEIPPTATPDYGTYLLSVLDLDGETTLQEVRKKSEFPIRTPTYPPNIGEPDRVFYQQLGDRAFVVLVWLYPDTDDQVWISLYALGEGTAGFKGEPRVLEETQVNGERAIWTDGPHFFSVDGFYQNGRLVKSPVLIWTSQGLTYRLEADLSKGEMIRIAESIE